MEVGEWAAGIKRPFPDAGWPLRVRRPRLGGGVSVPEAAREPVLGDAAHMPVRFLGNF